MTDPLDLVIRNALVFDGSGDEPFEADIGVRGDTIAFVGRPRDLRGGRVIDARGLAAAPGFIDAHAHSDFTILADPRAEGKVCQGITTEITGNCGMSAAPLLGRALERREEDLRELGIRERWHSFEEYARLVRRQGSAVNMAMLAGHGNIRGSVVGYDDRQPDSHETAEMTRLLAETLDQGAIGLSTGLIYPPGLYSDTGELIRLAKAVAARGGVYASHMRSEGDRLMEAVEEVIAISQGAGVQVHISHIKTAGEKNWHKADEVIERILRARSEGLRIACDRYPYTASSTDLDAVLPAWVYAGGNEEELRRLNDPGDRQRVAREVSEQAGPGYWEKVTVATVSSEKNRWTEGQTVGAIARKLGLPPMEAVFRLLIEERLRVGAIFSSMNENNLRKFLSLPFCMVGTDSSARSFSGPTGIGKPHPRGFGTFPRLLGRLVREEGLFPLQEAVRKITSLAAQTFHLRGRGMIREGMHADIVVFDPGRIADRATFENPFQRPEGLFYVLVNGAPAVWEGEPTGRLGGQVLAGGGSGRTGKWA